MGIIVAWINHPIEARVVAEYPFFFVMERVTEVGVYRFCINKADMVIRRKDERLPAREE